jgi:hypothetical protein
MTYTLDASQNTARSSTLTPSEHTAVLLAMIHDTIASYRAAHGEAPAVVWASPDLHRAIVLELPALIGTTAVCRSHSLRGVAAVAVHQQFSERGAL